MASTSATPRPAPRRLRPAVADRHQVEIDYYSYGRDERTVRVVDPFRVFSDQGQWYVLG